VQFVGVRVTESKIALPQGFAITFDQKTLLDARRMVLFKFRRERCRVFGFQLASHYPASVNAKCTDAGDLAIEL
jgi:hypothetical protein